MATKNFISAVLAAVIAAAMMASTPAPIRAQLIGGASCEVMTATGPRDGAWAGGVCVAPMVYAPVVMVMR